MINAGLDQIIIIALQHMEMDKATLEIEESGRAVAALQGNIAGIKDLISYICAEFHVTQVAIESTGDVPFTIPELGENEFEVLRHDVETLRISEEWKAVLARVDERISKMKNHLLYEAEKSRDLDLCQGRLKGSTLYTEFFNTVEEDRKRRIKESEKSEKERRESLFGDEPGETTAHTESLDPLTDSVQASAAK